MYDLIRKGSIRLYLKIFAKYQPFSVLTVQEAQVQQ